MMDKLRFVKIQDVADISRGITWKSTDESETPFNGSIRVYKIPHIQPNKKRQLEKDPIYIKKNNNINRYLLENDDVLMVGSNGNPNRVGNVVLYKEKEPALFASFLLRLRAKNIVDKQFLYYQISGPLIQKSISEDSAGTTGLRNINVTLMKEKDFLLPPMKEQRKIAAILSSVDEAIEKTEKIIEQTEKVKKGLVNDLFQHGLNTKCYKQTKIGKIPSHWNLKKLDDLIVEYKNKTTLNNQYPVLTSSREGLMLQTDYYKGRIITRDNTGYHVIPEGYITYRSRSDDGNFTFNKNSIIDIGIVSHFYPVFDLKDCIKEYVLIYLNNFMQRQINAIVSGTSQLVLSFNKLKELVIPLPSVEEQREIITKIESVNDKIEYEQNKLIYLVTTKQGLMQELLTGKKRVKVDDSEEVLS